jgi:hypothetical protein
MFMLTKQKCAHCCRKSTMNQNCKYCENVFCFSCLQQEVHECKNISVMIQEKQTTLSNKLQKEKCVGLKIQKI